MATVHPPDLLVLSPLNSRIQRYDPIEQILFKYSHVLFPSSDLINTVALKPPYSSLSAAVTVPVIIFFHGGSFVHPSSDSAIYGTLCRRLVGICKAVVVSVNNRRAPENRYSCAYDDGWAAVKWVNSKPWPQSRKDSKVHIYLAGDSSGGNIVHNVAVRSIESGIEVMGNILLNPLFSGQKRTESEKQLDGKYFVKIQERDWYWRAFLPEGEDRDHPACNPFGPNGISLEGIKFPKSLVVVAGLDLIQDWQLAMKHGSLKKGDVSVSDTYRIPILLGYSRIHIGYFLK
ncbi:unnamed protein product [Camellia sinensis]